MWNVFFVKYNDSSVEISECSVIQSLVSKYLIRENRKQRYRLLLLFTFRAEALDKHSNQVKHSSLISKLLYTSVESDLIPAITIDLPCLFIKLVNRMIMQLPPLLNFTSFLNISSIYLSSHFQKSFISAYSDSNFLLWEAVSIKNSKITFLPLGCTLDIDMECTKTIMFLSFVV